jgi:hypothetical protein
MEPVTITLDVDGFGAEVATAGRIHGFACGVWGSAQRQALTRNSDLDVLYVGAPEYVTVVEHLLVRFASAPLRADVMFVEPQAVEAGHLLKSGTDLHAVYFVAGMHGDQRLARRLAHVRGYVADSPFLRAREAMSLLLGWRAAADLADQADPSFGKVAPGGTNLWVRLVQASQLRWPGARMLGFRAALAAIAEVHSPTPSFVLAEYERSLAARSGRVSHCIDADERARVPPATKSCLGALVDSLLPWLAANAGLEDKLLEAVISRLYGVFVDRSWVRPNWSPLDAMCVAACTRDCELLAACADNFGHDWWVAHALSLNPHTPAPALDMLLFGTALVTEWHWRTIRLYVARHPNADDSLLSRLLETPGLRDQDYDAAQRSLARHG